MDFASPVVVKVCEIVLRDYVFLSAVQTVLLIFLCILPPMLFIRIFPVCQVIRGCPSEYLGVINLHRKNSRYDLFRFRFYSSLCICRTPISSSQDTVITVLDRYDMYAGDKRGSGVGSLRLGRLLCSYGFRFSVST
jgi:hypothetical protein